MSQIEFSFQGCSKTSKLSIKDFEKNSDFYVGVSPNPQLIYANLA